ncbi:hypothetical protein [Actinomadura sp. 9N407]|uniref:hypothetical protein n=1 Tax=Actinomadura sp. 9N407 TaxID=3375154 RepID=UPI0037BB0FAF
MQSPVRARPTWPLLRLALVALVTVLAAGCLTHLGQSASALGTGSLGTGSLGTGTASAERVLPASAAVSAQASPDQPDDSGEGAERGHCVRKKAVAEQPSFSPAAEPAQAPLAVIPVTLTERVTAADPIAWVARSGPPPPQPDLSGLCVLRI